VDKILQSHFVPRLLALAQGARHGRVTMAKKKVGVEERLGIGLEVESNEYEGLVQSRATIGPLERGLKDRGKSN
jgi:hypothetical protein